uniref:Uncharacterized protein n=1 Tax=Lepeophtheirus salmonis TaxID=72036 RepID=A0A0K2TP38_LEPSM
MSRIVYFNGPIRYMRHVLMGPFKSELCTNSFNE